MSSFHDFVMVPATRDHVQLLDATGGSQQMPVAAAIRFVQDDRARRLVIDDVGKLPRTLAVGDLPADKCFLQAIIRLAHEERLVCLSTLRRVVEDATCPHLQHPPTANAMQSNCRSR